MQPEPSEAPAPEAPRAQARLERLERLERRVRLALWGISALLLLNLGVLYAVVVLVVDTPTSVPGVEIPGDGAEKEKPADPRPEMREFFARMTDLLDRAARKHGTNPADVLPTQTEIDEAIETRTMHSETSQRVMQRFREGFDTFDLPWPTVIPER